MLDAAPPAAPEAPAAADGEQQQQPKQQQRAPWRPVDPASPLGRLMACRGVGEMRAWRQGLQESGGFGAFELGAAIRNAVRAKGMSAGEREAYMRELLGLAGGVQLDSRAAAYLAWGPAKLGLPADDPGVAAALTLAMQHVDGMEVRRSLSLELRCCVLLQLCSRALRNPVPQTPHPTPHYPTTLPQARDAAALLWALGALRASPQEAQLQALLGRLEGQLSGLRVKDLTQAAVGALRLQPAPSAFLAELLRALDVKASGANAPSTARAPPPPPQAECARRAARMPERCSGPARKRTRPADLCCPAAPRPAPPAVTRAGARRTVVDGAAADRRPAAGAAAPAGRGGGRQPGGRRAVRRRGRPGQQAAAGHAGEPAPAGTGTPGAARRPAPPCQPLCAWPAGPSRRASCWARA